MPRAASPETVREYRALLTKGEDAIDPETWAGSFPAAYGIAPRVRIGANRWFNLLWLIPIGFVLLLVAVAVAKGLRATAGASRTSSRAIPAPASPRSSRRRCRPGCASSISSTCS